MHKKLKGWKWTEYKSLGKVQKMILASPSGCAAGEIIFSYDYYHGNKYYSHTWDENGGGGENGAHEPEETLEEIKGFVENAIVRQCFHLECKHDCFDYGDEEEAAILAYDFFKELCKHDRKIKKDKFKEIILTMLGPKRYEQWLKGELK